MKQKKRKLSIYTAILTLLIGSNLLIHEAHASAALFEVRVNNNPASFQNGLYTIGPKTFKINFQPINFTVHPIALDVTFEDAANQQQYQHLTTLNLQPLAIYNFPTYNSESGPLNTLVNQLLSQTNTYQGYRKLWTDEEDIAGVGDQIKLIFSQPKLIRFYKKSPGQSWCEEIDKVIHKIRILLPYGFDGEGASNNHLLHEIEHEKKSSKPKPDIWYLDGTRKLLEVHEVTYRTVPKNLKQWCAANGFSKMYYDQIVHGSASPDSEQIFVLNPPGTHPSVELNPNDPTVLNKYYKLEKLLYQNPGVIVFFDGQKIYQTKQYEWQCFEQNKTEDSELNFIAWYKFSNANPISCFISTVQPTKNVLHLPIGQAGDVQLVHQDNDFEVGFYQRTSQHNIHGGIIQVWDHLETAAATPVQINIIGMKDNNDQWVPLKGFPNVKPTNIGNQLMIDLTPGINDISGSQWKELRNYLLAVYWLKLEEPLLKCVFPDSPKETEDLSKKISKLLNKTNCLQIDFDCGYFIVGRDKSWAIKRRDAYKNRDKNDGTSWKIVLYNSELKTVLKDIPNNSELDLTILGLPNSSTLLSILLAEKPFSTILLKELDKIEWNQLKHSDVDLRKFLSKVRGLETLKLAHMSGSEKWDLPKKLTPNLGTITHLDLTGSPINLWRRNDFVSDVGQMKNLQSLKIIGTRLSNSQTVELAKNIRNLEKLSLVHIEMPYWVNTGIESWWRVMGEECQEFQDANVIEMPYRGLKMAATALPAAAFSLVIGTGADVVNYTPGVDVKRVLMSLSDVQLLTSLKMKVKVGSQQQHLIKKLFNSYRDWKLLQVAIEFVE